MSNEIVVRYIAYNMEDGGSSRLHDSEDGAIDEVTDGGSEVVIIVLGLPATAFDVLQIHIWSHDPELEDDDDGCDDLCDLCMSSGVCIEFTTEDGRTVCVECAKNFEEEEEEEE